MNKYYPINLIKHWDLVAILISMGVLLGFEMLGVLTKRGYATITALTLDYIPQWALAMVWGWLAWHFLIRPLK